jgi:hypothetical protein
MKTISYSPPNSLIFISDRKGGEPPVPIWGATILATPSCISIACFPEQDGPTAITLGGEKEIDPGYAPEFEGRLEIPNREIVVSTVDSKVILAQQVNGTSVQVKIWRSHPKWPENVLIGIA